MKVRLYKESLMLVVTKVGLVVLNVWLPSLSSFFYQMSLSTEGHMKAVMVIQSCHGKE